MNGDGMQDIVDMKSGSIAYWPNRGYGQWGATEMDCYANEYIDRIDVEFRNSPYFNNHDAEGVSLSDVNGDGLTDVVQLRFDAVDIWLNKGNDSFTARYTIDNTPMVNSGYYNKVRFADMNGSGTVDIVWTNAGGWKYLDLGGDYRNQEFNGGLRAGLLERIENGFGATTWIEYATTTELMLDAAQQGEPWETLVPTIMTVVRKMTTSDNLDKMGDARGVYTQEYIYQIGRAHV